TRFTDFKNQLSRDDQQPQHYMDLLAEGPTTTTAAPFTVLAPDDGAFDDVLRELYPEENTTLDSIGAAEMTAILNLHIHEQSAVRSDEFGTGSFPTLGGDLQVQVGDTIT